MVSIVALLFAMSASASTLTDTTNVYPPAETMSIHEPPSEISVAEQPKKHKGFFKSIASKFGKMFEKFSAIDTSYIEPQKYNFTLMLQNTNTYESYRLRSRKGNDFSFSPQPAIKLGPYVGWRWVFLGYTVDLLHLNNGNRRTEFDLSLYSSQIGIDLFYRKTGNDYRVSNISLGSDVPINTNAMHGIEFDGINVGIKGFNIYYIFNHRRFSYPAAFSQSTIQRRSCGSFLCGIGYTKHSLSVDWEKLYNLVATHLGEDVANKYMDSELKFKQVKHTDVSLSAGYAYNWVFAHNWLAAASLSMAIGYKSTTGNDNRNIFHFRDFSLNNLNIDGVGRFGVVWNNMKIYSGLSAILHTYNYKKSQFSTNTLFGTVNIYVGFNFGKKKKL